jgi:hypothetical protein
MRRTVPASERAVDNVLRAQGYLITRRQVLAAGVSSDALRHRLRPGGPWIVVLPGVYQARTGPLTAAQREIAAVLYAGQQCVITGPAALQRQGVSVPLTEIVDVLIPDTLKRQSAGFVRTHRTARMPERPWIHGGLRWAPVPRAVADVSRSELDHRDVRALVAAAVQARTCTVGELERELLAGPTQRSSALRAAIEEVADGVASVAEGDLRALIKKGRLPEPMYNAQLFAESIFLGKPDTWWQDAGVVGEVDSREYHLSPDLWAKTMARHATMSAQGIIVLHYTPRQIRTNADKVIAELRSAIKVGLARPRLKIRAIPSD